VLSENIQDEELALYRDLMESEAGHYTTLLRMPENMEHGIDVEKRINMKCLFVVQFRFNLVCSNP
jgi:tRNA-(ms[2]io[6]A)-hydroxylase